MYSLGVDCGATNLRVGLFEAFKFLEVKESESPLKLNPSIFGQTVKTFIDELTNSKGIEISQIQGIGIGVPGPLDLEKGEILKSSNIGNIKPINIKAQLESEFNTSIYIDRDTNLALLGEVWQGAAKNCKNVVMLTLGSGVGGAIMVEGEIERGVAGKAGEIGHMIIDAEGNLPKCGLGHKGCFEALINASTGLDELSTYLGYGLGNIVNLFNPEKIIIGGGKLKMGDFLPKAIDMMKEKGMKPAVDEVSVEYAKLKELSGVYGGAKLVLDGGL